MYTHFLPVHLPVYATYYSLASTYCLSVQSLALSIKVVLAKLDLMSKNVAVDIANDLMMLANDLFTKLESHTQIVFSSEKVEWGLDTIGKTLFANYPYYIPHGLNDKDRRVWMNNLGEAASCANTLLSLFNQYQESGLSGQKAQLACEIASRLKRTKRLVMSMFAPPIDDVTKALLAARHQINTWRDNAVAKDDAVSTSSIIIAVLQMREELATCMRHMSTYVTQDYPRLTRAVYDATREEIDARCYNQRLSLRAQDNVAKQSKYNMAIFILEMMSNYDSTTTAKIKVTFDKVKGDVFNQKVITLSRLMAVARSLSPPTPSQGSTSFLGATSPTLTPAPIPLTSVTLTPATFQSQVVVRPQCSPPTPTRRAMPQYVPIKPPSMTPQLSLPDPTPPKKQAESAPKVPVTSTATLPPVPPLKRGIPAPVSKRPSPPPEGAFTSSKRPSPPPEGEFTECGEGRPESQLAPQHLPSSSSGPTVRARVWHISPDYASFEEGSEAEPESEPEEDPRVSLRDVEVRDEECPEKRRKTSD